MVCSRLLFTGLSVVGYILLNHQAFSQNNCNGLRIRYDERYANNAAKCGAPSAVTFRNRSGGGNRDNAVYRWYINDSLIGRTSGRADVGFSYADTGVYNLKIVATDTVNGCTDSLEDDFLVYLEPKAQIQASADTVCQGSMVYFQPTVQDSWRFTNYFWRMPDNSTSTDTVAGYLFNQTGNQRVRLRVRNSSQCQDWTSKDIFVTSSSATFRLIDLNGQATTRPEWANCIIAAGGSDTFQLALNTPDSLFNYSIDFGDGNTLSGGVDTFYQGKTLYHTYQNLGTYTITMTGEDINGCRREIRGTVINERIPTAGIIGPPSGNQSGCAPLAVRFINSSYNVSKSTTFRWTYGDGASDNLNYANASDTIWHTYRKDASDCNLEVTLEADNACGSSIATWAYVNVFDEDKVSLTANNGFVCAPDSTITLNLGLERNCVAGQRYFYWDFGDGRNTGWITSAANQTVVYNTPGTYRVLVVDSNVCGMDSAYYNVTVRAQLQTGFTAGFIAGNPNRCVPTTLNLSDTSSGVANTSTWHFGDGNTSTAASPSYTYNSPGTFVLSLVRQNECETISAFDTIKVYGKPEAQIAQIDSSCYPATVQFINQTPHFSPNATFRWTLPDNSTSTAANPPNMTIGTPGNYSVQLIVSDSCGADTVVQHFRVLDAPTAQFNAANACEGNQTRFSNTSSIQAADGTIASYHWDFGDGNTSSLQNPNHQYSSDGNYQVRLISTSSYGCTDTISQSLSVYEQPGLSLSSKATSYCPNSPITLSASVTLGSATIDSLEWNFGNGTFSDDSVVVKQPFANDGHYRVGFWLRSNQGCTNTDSIDISINPLPEHKVLSDSVCLGNANTLIDQSANIASRAWDLDLDGNTDATQDTVQYTFSTTGNQKVYLHLRSQKGCELGDTLPVVVHQNPVAAIQPANDSICVGDSLTISNLSTNADTFYWELPQGSSAVKVPSKASQHAIFNAGGSYALALKTVSTFGCKDSTTDTIQVLERPIAAFAYTDSASCAPFGIAITNQSQHAVGFSWFNQNSLSSTSANFPADTLRSANDSSQISLVARNALGCHSDTTSAIFYTHSAPNAAFSPNHSDGCGPLTVQFTNNSQKASNYQWHFGNGQSSTLAAPSTTFSASASQDSVYAVKMVATSLNGCKDSITKPIRVYPKPLARFVADTTSGCGPLAVKFSNQSHPRDTGSINDMTFTWNFDNGVISNQKDTVVVFLPSRVKDTLYSVELKAFSEHGCEASAQQQIRVYPLPVVRFSQNALSGCNPLNLQLTNQSSPGDTGSIAIMQFNWMYASVKSSNMHQNTTFTNTGLQDSAYSVKLLGISEHGCKDSVQKTFTVFPNPTAQLNTNDTLFCKQDVISVQNQSILADTSYFNYGDALRNFKVTSTASQSKSYRFAGRFPVTLEVETRNGCTDRDTLHLRILEWPEARINSAQTAGCAPMQFSVANRSRYATAYEWLRNGSTIANTASLGKQNLSKPNDSFVLQLVANNAAGCRADTAQMVFRTYQNPDVAFTLDTNQGCGNTEVAFKNQTSHFNRLLWDFGDGGGAISQNPQHRYFASTKSDTQYVVSLTAITSNFCTDTITDTITLYPIPKVAFTPSKQDGCGPLSVKFTNQSDPLDTGSVNDMVFAWNFNNGATSALAHPAATFTASQKRDSIYRVKLMGYSEHGCVDSAEKAVTVFPDPTIDFTLSDTAGCHPLALRLQNRSVPNDTGSIRIMQFNWDLGNGRTSTKRHEQDTFMAFGNRDSVYSLKLIGETEHGCKDSAEQQVTVHPAPVARLQLSKDSACVGDSLIFNHANSLADSLYYIFGNGQDAGTTSPASIIQTYNSAKGYMVTLKAFTKHGCQAETHDSVYTIARPKAAFSTNTISGCAPQDFTFNNQSQNAIAYAWWVNQSRVSTKTHLAQQRISTAADSLNVMLIANNTLGCHADTATRLLYTFPDPKAAIAADTHQGCGPLKVAFQSQSTRASLHKWSFPNGSTSAFASTAHTFPASNTQDTQFTVQLLVESSQGCKDSTTQNIKVFPTPRVDFSPSAVDGCGPLSVQFQNHSSPNDTGSINIMRFNWAFGNDSSSSQTSPSTGFAASATQDSVYSVKLLGFSEHGCIDSAEQKITVYPKPTVKFSPSSLSGCHPLPLFLQNRSTPHDTGSIAIMQFAWTRLGVTDSSRNLIDTFYNTGNTPTSFTVQLWGASEHGCSDSSDTTITVNPLPKPAFSLSADSTCRGDSFNLQNLSLAADSFVYHWGDQISSSANNSLPSKHRYTNAGQYQLRLDAFNQYGCFDSTSLKTVAIEWPKAGFSPSTFNGCAPQQFHFQNTSQHAKHYAWTGNGQVLSDSASIHPQSLTSASDTLLLQLVANNALFCHADTISRVVFTHPDPVAQFSMNTAQGCGPLNVQFSSQSQRAFVQTWKFADGSSSFGNTASFQFAASKTQDTSYETTLLVQTVNGCKDSVSQTATVYPNPVARFAYDVDTGCQPLKVQFSNQSVPNDTGSIGIMQFEWDYRNGQSSTAQNGAATFYASKTRDTVYAVKLRAFSEHGCIDSTTQPIRVYPDPTVVVSPSVKHGCGPLDVQFINLSKPHDVSSIFDMRFEWDYGNGATSSGLQGRSVFGQPQFMDTTYQVQVIGYTEHGCSDTTLAPITVHPDPKAAFKPSSMNGCSPLEVQFANNSSPNDTGGLAQMQFIWDLENGIKSRSKTPSYTYYNFGSRDTSFKVEMVAISKWNCRDTTSQQITVHHKPRADFNTNEMFACSPFNLETQNTSFAAQRYQWFLGDERQSGQNNLNTQLISTPRKDSVFAIKLKAFTQHGCVDSAMRNVRIFKQVVAKFSEDHKGCTPYDAVFNSQSKNAMMHFWDLGNGAFSNHQNPQHRYTKEGSYTVKLKVVDITGCADSTEKANAVVLHKTPDARITLDTMQNELPNAAFSMQPTVWVSDGTVSYKWESPGQPTRNSAQNTYVYNSKGPKDIQLTANTDHCIDSSTATVDVLLPIPTPGFATDDREGCVEYEVAFTDTSAWAEEVEWFFGDGRSSKERNPVHTYKLPGTYKVTQKVLNERGQNFITYEDYITVHALPFVDFDPSPKVVYLPEADVTFNNYSFNAVRYAWYKNDTLFSADTTPVHRFNQEGTYDIKLVGYSDEGCADSTTHYNLVKVDAQGEVHIPNAFSPNGDGHNDGFRPIGYGIEDADYHLQIFNRWGERVFETYDKTEEWDGTFKGKMCEPAVFVWVLELKFAHGEVRHEKGNVTLFR